MWCWLGFERWTCKEPQSGFSPPAIAAAALLEAPLRIVTWNANALLHQVPRSRMLKLIALENMAAQADILLIQETHCSLEEFVVECPRLAELFYCEAASGTGSQEACGCIDRCFRYDGCTAPRLRRRWGGLVVSKALASPSSK